MEEWVSESEELELQDEQQGEVALEGYQEEKEDVWDQTHHYLPHDLLSDKIGEKGKLY